MSLINEALKKAQRQRSDLPAGTPGHPDTPRHVGEKRGWSMRTPSLLALGGAAALLVVLSVVITVFLVHRRPPQLTSSNPVVVKPVIRSEPTEPSPVIVAPPLVSLPAVTAAAVEHAPEPIRPRPSAVAFHEPAPADKVVEPTPPLRAPEKVASAITRTPVPTPASFDAHVITFVDAIRVTGIRSSGNESKVLMNDRVYRVNDIVDRSLALKLVKVEADMLTFTDANGVIYTKNF